MNKNLTHSQHHVLRHIYGVLTIKLLIFMLILSYFVPCSGATQGKSSYEAVVILKDGLLGKPAQFGLQQFLSTLDQKGFSYLQKEAAGDKTSSLLLVGTLSGSERIKSLHIQKRLELNEAKESLSVKRLDEKEQRILVVTGSDDRGLMYALLEMAQQVNFLEPGKDWFDTIKETSEKPLVPVRSMAVLLHSEDCEKDWYYSKEHWQAYFAMLAANRWNAFNLIFSHQTPYLSPLYAFHVKVEQHPEVKAKGLTEEQRIRNLEMLRYISSLAKQRGIDFTIGIWQQIAWEGKHQGSKQESMVTGLTRKNMHSYTYHALLNLLEECPDIQAVQLRINHESGIDYDEQTEFYRNSVFKAIKDCGRPIQLETRNVGLLRETLQAALDMGLPTRVSHKYWGEHMVFPYHPTRIMWTYSYGDWLKYPQRYQNLYQVWSLGSHRLLLWGDPEYVRRFAPTTLFQNSSGFEICAPLSQKCYGNLPGAWRIFRDKDREYYQWEFERYWSNYTLFGRLTYNPDESDEIWLRELRSRFGKEAAHAVARAYQSASRVIPLILGTATCDYNMYIWPEKDMGGLINFYLHFQTFNEPRNSNFMEFIENYLENKSSAKLSPEDMAQRMTATAVEIEKSLRKADALVPKTNKEYRATKKDFQILSGMASYFAQKIRAALNLGFFYKLGDYSCLKQAITHAERALDIWKKLSTVAEEIYYPNLVMGPGSYGHWKDNIVFVENDLEQLRHQEKLFSLLQNFDFGFDFGPKAYTDVTTIYTPWYTNFYTIEHRFMGVHPNSLFNPQQGFGWNGEVTLKADQPPKIPRTTWRASNLENLDKIPSRVLLSDFIQGTDPAVFRIDLPEGHYQATLVITDESPNPKEHGPMSVSVIERFGERPIIENLVVKKGEMIVKRFNFNMVGSRYSNFRLKLSAALDADFILNGLTFTRVEPHIAHLPIRGVLPGKDLIIQATVTLPPQILQPVKESLSIARGTTSTVEPPENIEQVNLSYSVDKGKSFQTVKMDKTDDFIYSATIPGDEVQEGKIFYFIEAADSIGQVVHVPRKSQKNTFRVKVTSDRTPPDVVHDPVQEWDPGKPLEIKAEISDQSLIERVLLYYRPTRQAMEYSKLTMNLAGNDLYTATIPGEAFTTEFDLIYYFEAIDEYGNGIFHPDPDKEDPHIVVKIRR